MSSLPVFHGEKVVQVVKGDFNNDGIEDVGISLWKSGNYGKALPFWVKENDDSYRMHLFIYTLRDGKMVSLWQSSNLPKENLDVKLADVDGDGKNELITLERDYFNWVGGLTTGIWRWNEWGFELISRK